MRLCLDSGASTHCSGDFTIFSGLTLFQKANAPIVHVAAEATTALAVGTGNIPLETQSPNGNKLSLNLKPVLYVPMLGANSYLSISQIADKGIHTLFQQNVAQMTDANTGTVMLQGYKSNGLYYLNCTALTHCHKQGTSQKLAKIETLDRWHDRWGHVFNKRLTKALNEYNIKFTRNKKDLQCCESCVLGKAKRKSTRRKARRQAKNNLGRVVTDLTGPITPPASDGERYIMVILDEHSHYNEVYCMVSKADALSYFERFKYKAENQQNLRIKFLRHDGGGEYVSTNFTEFLEQEGIHCERTEPYSSHQNGKAERFIQTLVNMANSLLIAAGAPKRFWREATYTASFLLNRLPTNALQGNKTPYEMWFKEKWNDTTKLKKFGCLAFAVLPLQLQKKFHNTALKCIMLGYSSISSGYVLYEPTENVIFTGKDVIFNEDVLPFKEMNSENPLFDESPEDPQDIDYIPDKSGSPETDEVQNTTPNSPKPRRSPRSNKGVPGESFYYPQYLNKVHIVDAINASTPKIPIPTNYNQAISDHEHGQYWLEAIQRELDSHSENNTWTLVEPPAQTPNKRKPLKTKWVFTVKYRLDGSVERYKARLVVRGDYQKSGVDYDATFSPVARYTSFRSFCAKAAKDNLELDHIDIKTAYLYGEIDKEIYMSQPQGLKSPGKEHFLCRLNKSCYGLKQAGRIWNHTIHDFLISQQFTQLKSDECVYIKRTSTNTRVYVLLFVDDIIIMSNSTIAITEFKSELASKFTIVDKGAVSCFLNIEVQRDRENRKLWLGQTNYIHDVLERFRHTNCTPVPTPEHPCRNNRLTKSMCPTSDTDIKYMQEMPFRELVGCLNYIATKTRPDICHALQQVSQFMANPGKQHWNAALRILKYLKGTDTLGIMFDSKNNMLKDYVDENANQVAVFSDSDWANDTDKRLSVGGHVFVLYGGIVEYSCKKARNTAMSSQEAEWYAACDATKAGKYLRNLYQELGIMGNEPMPILEDNQGCIRFATKSIISSAMRHIDLRYHFIREYLQRGIVTLSSVPTNLNIADIFTKALTREPFLRLRKLMRIEAKLYCSTHPEATADGAGIREKTLG